MEITYMGELRTHALHLPSGTEIFTDAPVDNHGKGASFSPTDLASCSLASCMMTIMGILAQTHGFDLVGTKAEVTKIMSASPRKVAEIHVRLVFPKTVVYDKKHKAMIKQAAQTCPVALSLSESVIQKVSFVFNESDEE
jgi:uncharacterized OsmC-like protein